MAFGTLVLVLILMACIGFFTKKGLIYLLWPVLLSYPSRLWQGLLPLNAGFDDVFILGTFALLVVKRQMRELNWVGWAALAFMGIMVTGEATGLFLTGGGMETALEALKTTLKTLVQVVFAITVTTAVRDSKDARRMLISYAAGMALGCLVVMFDFAGVSWATWFYVIESEEKAILRNRATGAFLSADGVGINVSFALVLIGHFLAYRFASRARWWALPVCMLLVGSLLASGSRTGMLALGATILLMLLFSRARKAVLLLVFLAAILFFTLPVFRDAFIVQWDRTVMQSEEVGGLIVGTGRWGTIQSKFRNTLGIGTLLCGPGATYFAQGGWYAHNGYVDILLAYGLIGVAWFGDFLRRFFKDIGFLIRESGDPLIEVFGVGVRWAMISSAIAALASDPPFNSFWVYNLFWAGAMVAAFARNTRERQKSAEPELGWESSLWQTPYPA